MDRNKNTNKDKSQNMSKDKNRNVYYHKTQRVVDTQGYLIIAVKYLTIRTVHATEENNGTIDTGMLYNSS